VTSVKTERLQGKQGGQGRLSVPTPTALATGLVEGECKGARGEIVPGT
jgi:hypothetical protein